MRAVIIIPARLESTRLPRKLLCRSTGKPLIVHTCEVALDTGNFVIVGADSPLIEDAILEHMSDRVRVVPTEPELPSGTDRVHRVTEILRFDPRIIVVNLQADEPELHPSHLESLVSSVYGGDVANDMFTLATPATPEDQANPDVVKVAVGSDGCATDFSRDPLPGGLRHIGAYAYSVHFLRWFVRQPQTEREQTERLEQLRALEAGRRIHVLEVQHPFYGIDTRDDYIAFAERYVEKHGVTV